MRAPTRDLRRTTNFGSIGLAHAKMKQDLAERMERVASLEETQTTIVEGTRMSSDELDRIANIFNRADQFRDVIDDAEAQRRQGRAAYVEAGARQENTGNLPAIFNTQLATAQGEFLPKWHLVRHLPMYMQEPLRALGRMTLNSFTRTDMENVRLTGTKIAPEHQLREMMSWVRTNGRYIEQPDKETMDFGGLFDNPANANLRLEAPGVPDGMRDVVQGRVKYEATVKLFEVDGVDFLLVRDNFSHYIYSWPTKDRIGLDLQLEANEGPKLLGG